MHLEDEEHVPLRVHEELVPELVVPEEEQRPRAPPHASRHELLVVVARERPHRGRLHICGAME